MAILGVRRKDAENRDRRSVGAVSSEPPASERCLKKNSALYKSAVSK